VTAAPFIAALERPDIPKKDLRILTIGCGSAHLEETLSTMFSNCYFLGVDISETRIQEARMRCSKLVSTNTYEFIQADIKTWKYAEHKPFDILISRFVLSHLPNALQIFDRLLPALRPDGFLFINENFSDSTEFRCNRPHKAYEMIPEIITLQLEAEGSSFDTGAMFLAEFLARKYTILHTEIAQGLLREREHKSLLRLGLEDANFSNPLIEAAITSFKKFEDDMLAFGTYVRTLIVIARLPLT
jgi:trans-aconitate methyltransferase